MPRRKQEASQEELEILQLPDEEVKRRFNEFVEAWDQHEVAEARFTEFKAKANQPTPRSQTLFFEGIESVMRFNRQRRERVGRCEELRRNRDASAERVKESAFIVQVLLPPVCTLIHHQARSRYVIRNENGQVTVTRTCER